MATFVQLGEENPGYDLAIVLNSINSNKPLEQKQSTSEDDEQADAAEFAAAKESALGKLVASKKYNELLSKNFMGAFDKIMALKEIEMVDTVFSLAFAILPNLTPEEMNSFVSGLCTRFTDEKTKEHLTELKLNLMCFMFNMLDATSPIRHTVYTALLKFALATNNASLCMGQEKSVEVWMEAWNLDKTAEAEVHLLISQLCEQAEQFQLAQSYLVKYLNTISTSTDTKARSAAKPHAQRAAIAAIKSFTENPMAHPQYDCDRIKSLSIIQELEKDKEYANTFALLNIFACDTVGKYLDLVKQQPGLCQKLGLDHEQNLQKLRALTICSLGMEHERLSYETLIDKLRVDDKDAVEAVVIDAVMAGRVDAKIDQEKEEVIIHRTTQRVFRKQDWRKIGNKLESWKNNIHEVLRTLHHVHEKMLQRADPDYQGDEEED
mmetsp:Transcript_29773/g.41638  ORF Transcript_29773/g.41638 Transcript_29773/m.41638 type:complete len:436 (-) Transcript_29773:117-1424(-)|eukprot:CAMPEP_0175094072 /NCGR_PEP_ID=MMETSP0086_2-20121207/3379_1 /TAXON_ID=136419 /ORGANISM="Unknown Unknown, Strain D1" /LENGTH=435 /DNA_ID=CAMNT_0016367133 /DNA_START=23 /DNA_END=1330 /DNA_ORIENTATION=-